MVLWWGGLLCRQYRMNETRLGHSLTASKIMDASRRKRKRRRRRRGSSKSNNSPACVVVSCGARKNRGKGDGNGDGKGEWMSSLCGRRIVQVNSPIDDGNSSSSSSSSSSSGRGQGGTVEKSKRDVLSFVESYADLERFTRFLRFASVLGFALSKLSGKARRGRGVEHYKEASKRVSCMIWDLLLIASCWMRAGEESLIEETDAAVGAGSVKMMGGGGGDGGDDGEEMGGGRSGGWNDNDDDDEKKTESDESMNVWTLWTGGRAWEREAVEERGRPDILSSRGFVGELSSEKSGRYYTDGSFGVVSRLCDFVDLMGTEWVEEELVSRMPAWARKGGAFTKELCTVCRSWGKSGRGCVWMYMVRRGI